MARWKQRLFDWERANRNRLALSRHLSLCGLPEADRRVILALEAHGVWTRDGEVARSILEAPMRRVASLAELSLGGLHKAKGRLIARGLVAYHAETGTWVLSWARVWAMAIAPDAVAIAEFRAAAAAGVRARSRAPQEQRKISLPTPSVQDQVQSQDQVHHQRRDSPAGVQPISVDVADCGQAAQAFFGRQRRELAGRILAVVRPIEARCELASADRLQPVDAERIADGVLGAEHGHHEWQGVVRSLHRKMEFTRSPGAFLVGCAQRRGWLSKPSKGDSDACARADQSTTKSTEDGNE